MIKTEEISGFGGGVEQVGINACTSRIVTHTHTHAHTHTNTQTNTHTYMHVCIHTLCYHANPLVYVFVSFAASFAAWNNLDEGMEAVSKKGKKQKDFLVKSPKKKPSPGRIAHTPRVCTGDSVGWFRRYHCSTLINYDCNLFMCGTFLKKMLHLLDNRKLLPTPKETYDLNLSEVILRISSFRTTTSIFSTKELYNPGLLPSFRIDM